MNRRRKAAKIKLRIANRGKLLCVLMAEWHGVDWGCGGIMYPFHAGNKKFHKYFINFSDPARRADKFLKINPFNRETG